MFVFTFHLVWAGSLSLLLWCTRLAGLGASASVAVPTYTPPWELCNNELLRLPNMGSNSSNKDSLTYTVSALHTVPSPQAHY